MILSTWTNVPWIFHDKFHFVVLICADLIGSWWFLLFRSQIFSNVTIVRWPFSYLSLPPSDFVPPTFRWQLGSYLGSGTKSRSSFALLRSNRIIWFCISRAQSWERWTVCGKADFFRGLWYQPACCPRIITRTVPFMLPFSSKHRSIYFMHDGGKCH